MFFWILPCVIALIAFVIVIIHFIKGAYYRMQDNWLVNEFSRCNVIVFGKKGTGKDLIFAHVISLRGGFHYANMRYNDDTDVITLDRVSVGRNSYDNVINDNVRKIPPAFEFGCDIYISDGGIYLPSQYNGELNNKYKSMPLFYALSRQLYRNNIHVNVQALGRVWDKLREQADSYLRCREVIDKDKYLYVRLISYEEYNAASRNLLPCRDSQYRATNGDIKERLIRIPKKELQYDTYYFSGVFLEQEELKSPLEDGFLCLKT